jgi:hypothetical protein
MIKLTFWLNFLLENEWVKQNKCNIAQEKFAFYFIDRFYDALPLYSFEFHHFLFSRFGSVLA